MEIKNEVAVVGGANVDLKGIANQPFRMGSSNPGKIYKSPGGVARNLAENLARLKIPVNLYSVVGNDAEGKWLIEVTKEAGVNVEHLKVLDSEKTGIYLSILNEEKEQVGSIADMEIMNAFSVNQFSDSIERIKSTKYVFVDSNMSDEALKGLFESLYDEENIIVVDPVSVEKARKIVPYLNYIDIITPNKEEAEIITDIKIETEADLVKVKEALFDMGVTNIIITLGSDGVFIATPGQTLFLGTREGTVTDTTGAGDSFTAGLIYGLYRGYDLFEASKYGQTLAAITLAREESVAKDLSEELLSQQKKELFIDE